MLTTMTNEEFRAAAKILGHSMPGDAERQTTADALKSLPIEACHLTVEELEMDDEDLFGIAVPVDSAAEGVASMERRLANLRQSKAKVLDRLEEGHWPAEMIETLNTYLAELNRHLAIAQERKAHFELQVKTIN